MFSVFNIFRLKCLFDPFTMLHTTVKMLEIAAFVLLSTILSLLL